ncbi:hypothetical protein ASF28_14500 [Methylobacterium sp. Leaf99]|uniref:hypothetical protein n=1 Tax=unclassified Methylobacterium TaxID=2615210 RepID=UPI0006F79457|nr:MULTISPECIES: hypothetical protein [unclassified Methylobacterium]KQP07208.1 hypothetical protein ASF28_14500 [Methylobacterium sp. Leaf99]TXM75492.1 hypothetical protein FV218_08705 [Methylobacterium sp. WL69]
MLLASLLVLTALVPSLAGGVETVRRAVSEPARDWSALGTPLEAPHFLAESRAVSNWRTEAGTSLRPASLALAARWSTTEPAFVARCVKLNNYWCIKKARWSGEIGADAEGHTGFATAADGADAAAGLLRRYYRDFNRRTALAIVRRWAPAECRGTPPTATRVPTALAPRGLGGTLRARFLARNTRAGMPRRALAAKGGPLRVQPWSPLARMGKRVPPGSAPKTLASVSAKPPATPRHGLLVRPSELLVKPSVITARPSVLLVEPSVVLGNATRAVETATAGLQKRFVAESAALPPLVAGLHPLDLSVPTPFCGTDETRIRNYAARIANSVGLKVEDDLNLFGPDGRPLPALRAVMLAMSSVELGALRAGPALVDAAIGRLDAGTLAAVGPPAPIP